MDSDEAKSLTLAIAYQCKLETTWTPPLQELHHEIAKVIEKYARLNKRDVQVAKEYRKPRPTVTAFSDGLCHLERLGMDKMMTAAGPAGMCPEYDGLILWTDYYGTGLAEVARKVKDAAGRPLSLKPYPKTVQEWLQMAKEKYPYDDWSASSRFQWAAVRKSWTLTLQYMTADEPRKLVCPDADFAVCVAMRLENRVVVHPGGVAVFDGGKWGHVNKTDGLHEIVKKAAQKILVTNGATTYLHNGKRCVKHGNKSWLRVRTHEFLTTLRMEVSAALNGQEPTFNVHRHLMPFSNGRVYDFQRDRLVEQHPNMMIEWQVPWPMEELDTPQMREYRTVVKDVVAHWTEKKPTRPDLQIIREETEEDDGEPKIVSLGVSDLVNRFRKAATDIEYLRVRLSALCNNIDTLIYKEQWNCRAFSSMEHLCELLYIYGPPGCGKDVDALFLQEFFGSQFRGGIPTNDVVRLPNQQERGVDASTPTWAALVGKKVALVAEVPKGKFAWFRLKHYVEQQGIAPTARGNHKEQGTARPTFAIFLWSNYAPQFEGEDGAERRAAVLQLSTRYGSRQSVEDDEVLSDNQLKYRIIRGDFVQEQFWCAIVWLQALRTYATAIPKPYTVAVASAISVTNPVLVTIREKFEACVIGDASAQPVVKAIVAAILNCGVRDADLPVQMRVLGFSLDCNRAQNKGGKVCKLVMESGATPVYVKIRSGPAPPSKPLP